MGVKKDNKFEENKKKQTEIKLKSEKYHHDSEKIERREEDNDAVMWGFVIGFALFFVLLIVIILCIN